MKRTVVSLVVSLVLALAGLLAAVPAADAAGLADTVAPSVAGAPQVGETVTADPGQWTPAPTAFAYHWLRDGQPIAGAQAASYTPVPVDADHQLSVRVDAADDAGQTGSATSAPVAVAPGLITARGGQRIVGVVRDTRTVTVRTGRFSVADPTVTVQWRSHGADVAGAADVDYAVGPTDVGGPLVALLTVTAPGYADLRLAVRSPAVGYRIDVRRTVTYSVQTRGRITTGLAQFRTLAQQTYDDARGWRSSGIRFVPVDRGGSFTLVLAQASLVPSFSSACSSTWSCRVGRYVVINQDRWLHASPAWNAAHQPLVDYRHMVVNHETGHWLGLGHAPCPGPGRLAPVMMQQSKGLHGCRFNPWPLPGEIAGRTPSARRAVDYRRTWVE